MVFSCGNWYFSFGETGGLTKLNNTKTDKVWATEDHILGQYLYTTFDNKDYIEFIADYCYCGPNCQGWIPNDFGKPNVQVAQPERGQWKAVATSLWVYEDSLTCSYYLSAAPSTDLHTNYGAPSTIWTQTNFTKTASSTANTISMNFEVYDKTPTRLPEAHWFEFHPVTTGQGTWYVDKCGQMVDPSDVVLNGSMRIHGQLNGVHYKAPNSEVWVESLDVALVSLGSPSPFPTPMVLGKPADGLFFNFMNNIWGTNYVMWYPWRAEDANSLYRFRLTLQNFIGTEGNKESRDG